jgi:hypothetical protein
MSDPPLAPTLFSGKKKSRNGGTNVSKKHLMDFKALIAYDCYNSPSITGASVNDGIHDGKAHYEAFALGKIMTMITKWFATTSISFYSVSTSSKVYILRHLVV